MLRRAAIGLGEVTLWNLGRSSRIMPRPLVKAAKCYTMFSKENDLPQLPVPPLEQTLEKYLLSLVPLLTKEEFKRAEDCVKEFGKPGGVGEKLQDKLVIKAQETDNWLAEWWDNCAYLQFTEPVVVHSSPGLVFPRETFNTQKDQLRFAARMIRNALSFKAEIDSRTLSVDMQGKIPTTMVQYKKLFSTCRIPNKTGDYCIVTPKEDSRHIIVMHNNHFFALDVYWYGTNKRLSEEELIYQLEQIVKSSSEPDPNPIGILTSTNRTIWAANWKKLRRDRINRFGLDTIIKSILVLCLDQPCSDIACTPAKGEDQSRSISGAQSLHGGGTESNSCNRYFDKIIQLYVNRDGRNGCCYEHSAAEGPPVQRLVNYLIENRDLTVQDDVPLYAALDAPKKLEWNINPALQDKIECAMDYLDSLVDDVEIRFFKYSGYGKNVAKKFKLSPDGWLQMAFHLSFFRIHGHVPPTYESASTKKFKRARTDTIRTASIAAHAFCLAMDSQNTPANEKRDLFRRAVSGHIKYAVEAMNGQGIDRHLLGLKIAALESKIPLPEIFRDKGYIYSQHHKVSTSQVPSPHDTTLLFGPTVPDGYGICYNPREKDVNLVVTAFNSNPSTHAGLFGETIFKSLDDLQLLMTTSNL